jgi:hypothetical protein
MAIDLPTVAPQPWARCRNRSADAGRFGRFDEMWVRTSASGVEAAGTAQTPGVAQRSYLALRSTPG